MTLTPLDIEHATFERALFGYRAGAVRALLERVAAERERSLREMRHMRDEIAERDEEIASLREAEAELQRAVIAAERIASEMKDNAREAARLIEAEARAKAEAVIREAEAAVAAAHAELARLEQSQAIVREQLRGQLTGFLRALDAVEGPRVPVEASAAGSGPGAVRHDTRADDAWAIGEEDLPG